MESPTPFTTYNIAGVTKEMNGRERQYIEHLIEYYEKDYQDILQSGTVPGYCCRQLALQFARELKMNLKL